ncbi:hypothetical protein N0V91_001648 [Didymella pomorum]|uniref:Uncharacterized protein n=1 Tax=Didymella pomorum TaxID=749634 RepID=A0A9W8ZJU5_9PLEO|nr:hypothetical protein N0V91_001648 [Didymella pomorum]
MATSDYYPYPMYTAQDSTPLRRRQDSLMTSPSDVPQYNGPTTNKRFRLEKIMSMVPPPKPAPLPKPVQRVDSGFDAASETSSVTFTDEVERLQAAKLYLHRYHDHDLGAADEDEEEDFVDEGNLGLMHRDSICLVAERAVIWEDKAVRAKRNSKSKLELAKKWLERKLVPVFHNSASECFNKALEVLELFALQPAISEVALNKLSEAECRKNCLDLAIEIDVQFKDLGKSL